MDPTRLKLTQQDDQIYSRFRESFPDLKVEQLIEDELKSSEGKAVIRPRSQERVSMVASSRNGARSVRNSKRQWKTSVSGH